MDMGYGEGRLDLGPTNRLVLHLVEEKRCSPNSILPGYGIAAIHLVSGIPNENFGCKALKLFLRHDGDPNLPSEDMMTPVLISSFWNRKRILCILLHSGGNPFVKDQEGFDALSFAKLHKNYEVLKILNSFLQGNSSRGVQGADTQLRFEKTREIKKNKWIEYEAEHSVTSLKATTHFSHNYIREDRESICCCFQSKSYSCVNTRRKSRRKEFEELRRRRMEDEKLLSNHKSGLILHEKGSTREPEAITEVKETLERGTRKELWEEDLPDRFVFQGSLERVLNEGRIREVGEAGRRRKEEWRAKRRGGYGGEGRCKMGEEHLETLLKMKKACLGGGGHQGRPLALVELAQGEGAGALWAGAEDRRHSLASSNLDLGPFPKMELLEGEESFLGKEVEELSDNELRKELADFNSYLIRLSQEYDRYLKDKHHDEE